MSCFIHFVWQTKRRSDNHTNKIVVKMLLDVSCILSIWLHLVSTHSFVTMSEKRKKRENRVVHDLLLHSCHGIVLVCCTASFCSSSYVNVNFIPFVIVFTPMKIVNRKKSIFLLAIRGFSLNVYAIPIHFVCMHHVDDVYLCIMSRQQYFLRDSFLWSTTHATKMQ